MEKKHVGFEKFTGRNEAGEGLESFRMSRIPKRSGPVGNISIAGGNTYLGGREGSLFKVSGQSSGPNNDPHQGLGYPIASNPNNWRVSSVPPRNEYGIQGSYPVASSQSNWNKGISPQIEGDYPGALNERSHPILNQSFQGPARQNAVNGEVPANNADSGNFQFRHQNSWNMQNSGSFRESISNSNGNRKCTKLLHARDESKWLTIIFCTRCIARRCCSR